MTDKTKSVVRLDPDVTIAMCCESARDTVTKAVPTVCHDGSLGYVLENDADGCKCAPQYVAHNWRKQHAEFVTKN